MNELKKEDIELMLDEKKFAALKAELSEMNPIDIAELLEEVPPERLVVIFRLLPKELAAELFVEMDSDMQEELIVKFSDAELHAIIEEMYIDDTVDIIEEMPANVVKRILSSVDADTRATVNQILRYPHDSAGSIMTTEYVTLHSDMTVAEAFERVKKTGTDSETIYTLYVTTRDRKLVGVVTAKDLLLSDKDKLVSDIMVDNVIFAYTDEDREDTVNKIREYGFMALPVVDREERIVGIVTYDDAIDVLTEESEEDFQVMAAVTPTDDEYLKTGVFKTWLARIPWLLILMVSATFTGLIITGFEDQLAAVTALTAFIPMLMDTAGNAGGQASVTVIRGLALEEIAPKDILRVIWKECRVALLCGVVLAVANFAKILLVDHLWLHNFDPAVYAIGDVLTIDAVVCITLIVTIFIAKLIGSTLPIVAKKIGFDPAVMASPFITTIVDALSLLTYFTIAKTLIAGL